MAGNQATMIMFSERQQLWPTAGEAARLVRVVLLLLLTRGPLPQTRLSRQRSSPYLGLVWMFMVAMIRASTTVVIVADCTTVGTTAASGTSFPSAVAFVPVRRRLHEKESRRSSRSRSPEGLIRMVLNDRPLWRNPISSTTYASMRNETTSGGVTAFRALPRLQYSQNGDPLDVKPTLQEEELVGVYHLDTTATTTSSTFNDGDTASATSMSSNQQPQEPSQHDLYKGRRRSTILNSSSSSWWWGRKPRWLRVGGGSSSCTTSHATAGGSLWSTAARNFTNVTTATKPTTIPSSNISRNDTDNSNNDYLHHRSPSDEGVIQVGEGSDDDINDASPVFVSDATGAPLSAHLQLTHPRLLYQKKNGTDDKNNKSTTTTTTGGTNSVSSTEETAPASPPKPPGTVTIHTYRDVFTNTTWKALNTPKRKFAAFLQYSGCNGNASTIGWANSARESSQRQLMKAMETTQVVLENTLCDDKKQSKNSNNNNIQEPLRREWRALWSQGRLLTDRTELLAVYPSDGQQQQKMNLETIHNNNSARKKRGGFSDLLHLYTDRLVAMLQDELEDAIVAGQRPSAIQQHSATGTATSSLLVGWLEKHYGSTATNSLKYENFQELSQSQQLLELKVFLEWFRSLFPYFYDRCSSCGASFKEDSSRRAPAAATAPTGSTSSPAINNDDDEDALDDGEHETFIGYVFPSKNELFGKASRTELYQCHICNEFTRFPRFNSATHVMDSRRGRCGEYSMLLFRFLRALHHECRWVVDWADHVWAEVLLVPSSSSSSPPRWVHLDPCEAAVDENLIYQGWGKKQTYVLGFYLPPVVRGSSSTSSSTDMHRQSQSRVLPLIEDITQTYTSDSWYDICQRRDETPEEVVSAISNATKALQDMLQKHDEKCKAEHHQHL